MPPRLRRVAPAARPRLRPFYADSALSVMRAHAALRKRAAMRDTQSGAVKKLRCPDAAMPTRPPMPHELLMRAARCARLMPAYVYAAAGVTDAAMRYTLLREDAACAP